MLAPHGGNRVRSLVSWSLAPVNICEGRSPDPIKRETQAKSSLKQRIHRPI
jgi:hypothetical protein